MTPPAIHPLPADSATRTVLYVEDDPVNAMLMQGIVELRPGYRLHVASSGAAWRSSIPSGRG